jgi:hypothetical protein
MSLKNPSEKRQPFPADEAPVTKIPRAAPAHRPASLTAGRVQAPRHDPSLGQRDRNRGARLKGGKRAAKRASQEGA